jgi:hypothetical protein
MAKQIERGGSQYDYKTGKCSTCGKKPEGDKGPSMGRRVMPGDAHESMERKGKKGC